MFKLLRKLMHYASARLKRTGGQEYTIELAAEDALSEVSDFFAKNPEPGIRQLSIDELGQLTEDGLFYLARIGGEVVGTLYFQDSQVTGRWAVPSLPLFTGSAAC
jgi:hypothetical protein